MKTNAIVRIVLYALAIVVLVSILAGGLLVNTFMVNTDWESLFDVELPTNSGTLASSGQVSADEIRDIQIDWAAGSITIVPGDTDTIQFQETATASEEDQLVWKQSGDKLVIQFTRTQTIFGINVQQSKDLIITVPRDWVCDELEIDSASARVEVNDLTISSVDFDGASGICVFENCNVGSIDLDTASGDVRFQGTLNELDCDAASASCTIVLTNVPKRIDIDTASGDLDLTLPAECGFSVSMDSLSGDFSSDFATTNHNGNHVHGDGSCRISISAMSGDVIIRKGNTF